MNASKATAADERCSTCRCPWMAVAPAWCALIGLYFLSLPGKDTIPPFVPPLKHLALPGEPAESHPSTVASWSPSTLRQNHRHMGHGNGEQTRHRSCSTLSASHHFKSRRATQKTHANCTFQVVLKSPLHLSCGHVLSVSYSVLVQGTSAPPLGAPCTSQSPGNPCLHGASGRGADTWIKLPAFAAPADLYSFRGRFENVAYHVQHY